MRASPAAEFTEADLAYVRAGFVPLDELSQNRGDDPDAVRAEIDSERLPQPSYVLPDGTEMVPSDYFALADAAGGVERLRELFLERYRAATAAHELDFDEPEDEWRSYLTGEYGVCLKQVTPESIVLKSVLIGRIDRLLAEARPESDDWKDDLHTTVDSLDELERPFAPAYDRARFGGPSSRDRLISAVRSRFPAVFGQ